MKRLFAFAIALTLAVSLAGCATPLTSKDLKISIDLGDWAYSLVGDEAIVTGKVEIVSDNGSNFVLALQTKNSTDDWITESSKPDLTGDVDSKFALKVTAEGQRIVRVAVLDQEEKVIATSNEGTIVVKDLKAGITKLDYDWRMACETSERKCFDYRINKNYPGLNAMSKKDQDELFSKYRWGYFSTAPNLDTVQPDPTWLFTPGSCKYDRVALDVSKPLPGRTFILQNTGSSPNSYHVTYLKGEFYFYPYFC